MRLQKTVVTDKPLGKVFDCLSDFTSTTDWDPGTVATVRLHGDGRVGTSYLNTSEFLGRQSELRYVVQEFMPGERIRLRGENTTVVSVDTMTFRPAGAGTEVTYTAEFAFKGAAQYLAPFLRPALARLGNQAEAACARRSPGCHEGDPAPAAADGDFPPLTVPLPRITSPRRAAITRCRTRATNLPSGGTRAFADADLELATL